MKSMSSYNDSELMSMLRGSKTDSERAFGEIYARYSQRIYAYLTRMLDSDKEINDLFQETFVKFYENYHKEKNLTYILGLLITIARNLSLNYKRSYREKITFEEYLAPQNDELLEDRELIELAKMALSNIDPEHREIFILRLYEDMSYQEISELTGLQISTARNRFARAKEKMKVLLEPYLEEMKNDNNY